MKRMIVGMAVNNTTVKDMVVSYVAYSVYLQLKNSGRLAPRFSSNRPGKLVVIDDTTQHSGKSVTFQLTPLDDTHVRIVCEFDNVDKLFDVNGAIQFILNY